MRSKPNSSFHNRTLFGRPFPLGRMDSGFTSTNPPSGRCAGTERADALGLRSQPGQSSRSTSTTKCPSAGRASARTAAILLAQRATPRLIVASNAIACQTAVEMPRGIVYSRKHASPMSWRGVHSTQHAAGTHEACGWFPVSSLPSWSAWTESSGCGEGSACSSSPAVGGCTHRAPLVTRAWAVAKRRRRTAKQYGWVG